MAMPFPKKPHAPLATTHTRQMHTNMAFDKDPKSKGVECRIVRLIVDEAESALRQNHEVRYMELGVTHVDRGEHPNLSIDLCTVTDDAICELLARTEDVDSTLTHLHLIEFGSGKLLANLEFTKEDVDA